MSKYSLFFIICIFSTTALAEVSRPTNTYNRISGKMEVRGTSERSQHPLSGLELAKVVDRNHALFFGTTSQTPREASSKGLILESYCSASHVNVGEVTIILSSYHCLTDSSYFYPYFLGFVGAWTLTNFDYAVAAAQDSFEVTDPTYDIALFKERTKEMMASMYFRPRTMADKLPAPTETVRFVGFPVGLGPVNVECSYRGLFFAMVNGKPKHYLFGKLHCPALEGHWIGGASGSAVLDKQGQVIGVLRSAYESYAYFVPLLAKNIKIKDDEISLDFSSFQGRVKAHIVNDDDIHFDCKFSVNKSGLAHGKSECRERPAGQPERSEHRNGILVTPWHF